MQPPAQSGLDADPLDRRSLADRVYAALRQALIRGELLPEQTLSIRGIADAYGVSTMPARAAVTRLQAEGALEAAGSRMMRIPALTPQTLDEITDMRVALEGLAADRGAAQATAADREALTAALTDLAAAAAGARIDGYLEANARFHFILYRAAGRPRLERTIEALWLIVGPSIRVCVPDRAHLEHSMTWHRKAAEAFHDGDGPAAAAAVTGDIRDAARDMRATLVARLKAAS